jgi:hypothetical protein
LAFYASTFVAEIRNKESMQTNTLTLSPITDRPFELARTSAKMIISEVFAKRKASCLNPFTSFVDHFNSIPNEMRKNNIGCKRANKGFRETYKSEIKHRYSIKHHFNGSKQAAIEAIFYILFNDLIVEFDINKQPRRRRISYMSVGIKELVCVASNFFVIINGSLIELYDEKCNRISYMSQGSKMVRGAAGNTFTVKNGSLIETYDENCKKISYKSA